jgi:AcrR family transcriptional regulator
MSTAEVHQLPDPAYRRAPAEKQALLLDAARELFKIQGFDKTTTLEISRKAGVSEGTLFNHFGSKRGLFAKLAEDYGREAASSALADQSVELSSEVVVRSAFAFANRDPALYRLFVMDAPHFEDFEVTSATDVILSILETDVQTNVEAGRIRPCDCRVMSELQLAIVFAAYAGWSRSDDANRRETYIEEAVRSLDAMMEPTE